MTQATHDSVTKALRHANARLRTVQRMVVADKPARETVPRLAAIWDLLDRIETDLLKQEITKDRRLQTLCQTWLRAVRRSREADRAMRRRLRKNDEQATTQSVPALQHLCL